MRVRNNDTIFVALFILIGGAHNVLAQKVEFPLLFSNITPSNTVERQFVFGAHPAGSDSLDSNLGETEIPSLPLPGDIFYVWSVAPIEEVLWLSPKEMRRLRIGEQYLEVYDIRINWNGGTLEINLPYPIPSYIDSIYVVDGKTTYPNNQISVKMLPGTKVTSDNPAFDKFNVMVWYNVLQTSVNEKDNVGVFRLLPNPAQDYIIVESEDYMNAKLEIIELNGTVVQQIRLVSRMQTISISELATGIFIARLNNGKSNSTQFFLHH